MEGVSHLLTVSAHSRPRHRTRSSHSLATLTNPLARFTRPPAMPCVSHLAVAVRSSDGPVPQETALDNSYLGAPQCLQSEELSHSTRTNRKPAIISVRYAVIRMNIWRIVAPPNTKSASSKKFRGTNSSSSLASLLLSRNKGNSSDETQSLRYRSKIHILEHGIWRKGGRPTDHRAANLLIDDMSP